MSDTIKLKGWQRKLLGQSHYFDTGKDTSLCGKAGRVDHLPITPEPTTSKCLVCFCKLTAIPAQREMYDPHEISDKQITFIRALARDLGIDADDLAAERYGTTVIGLGKRLASEYIDYLNVRIRERSE